MKKLFMVKQHTHTIKKMFLIVLLFVIVFSGCKKEIPEGDIKAFVMNFDAQKAYENVNYGSFTLYSTMSKEGSNLGEVRVYNYIDKRDGKYHYSKSVVSGDYHGTGNGQYNFYTKETITYLDSEGNIIAYEKTDGIIEEKKYRIEDLDLYISNFFYTSSELSYHTGGAYYGDYILKNCAQYYNLFKLNEEKTILDFKVTTIYDDKENQKILVTHEYNVNSFGMVNDLTSKSEYESDSTTFSITTMNCNYEDDFEKIYSFNIEEEE